MRRREECSEPVKVWKACIESLMIEIYIELSLDPFSSSSQGFNRFPLLKTTFDVTKISI
jgi:hypothetical protein